MTSIELVSASMKYIAALSPFVLVFAVLIYAEELIQLLRSVILPRRGDKW